MKQGNKKNQESRNARARETCTKALAVIIEDYTEIARSLRYDPKEMTAFAEGAARLTETEPVKSASQRSSKAWIVR